MNTIDDYADENQLNTFFADRKAVPIVLVRHMGGSGTSLEKVTS